jgi:hypothetical protein
MSSVRQNYNKARELMKRFTAINSQLFQLQPSRQSPASQSPSSSPPLSTSVSQSQQSVPSQQGFPPRKARFASSPAVAQSRKSDVSGINSIAEAIAAAQAAERERVAAKKSEAAGGASSDKNDGLI